jgi:hypothetical protein
MRSLIAACLLCLSLAVCPVAAQTPTSPDSSGEKTAESGSPLPWAIAIVFTLIILLIVCMPSRKSET